MWIALLGKEGLSDSVYLRFVVCSGPALKGKVRSVCDHLRICWRLGAEEDCDGGLLETFSVLSGSSISAGGVSWVLGDLFRSGEGDVKEVRLVGCVVGASGGGMAAVDVF